jgi:hypothetical protein
MAGNSKMTAMTNDVSTHEWKAQSELSGGYSCVTCGEAVDARRWALGIHLCMRCGDRHAKQIVRCIVPLHKSNYILITDLNDLKGINNKGGLIR